jgi:RNA polymerase sigma-70 factor (ECF subfamily)
MTTRYQEESDENLMELVRAGNHAAFAALVRRHATMFAALAYRTLGDARDAEDVVQDCFVKLWRKPQAYQPERGAKFTTWFYRVVYNASIDAKRKHKRVMPLEIDVAEERASQAEHMVEQERAEMLEAAIKALPERQQAALNLCYYQDVPQKEAAEILGIGLKALESLLSRAKATLKQSFADYRENKEVSYAAQR